MRRGVTFAQDDEINPSASAMIPEALSEPKNDRSVPCGSTAIIVGDSCCGICSSD
jgi:hypothetical protein